MANDPLNLIQVMLAKGSTFSGLSSAAKENHECAEKFN